jgi:cytoskeletal protein RodZ
MGTNGDSILKVVELFIENINEQSKGVERVEVAQTEMRDLLKSTIRTIRVAAALFGLAVLIATTVVYFGTRYMESSKDHKPALEERLSDEDLQELKNLIQDRIDRSEKEKFDEK